MRCSFYQWMISRALDSGGRLPLRHMRKCEPCRLFHRRSVLLEHTLRAEAEAFAARPGRQTGPATLPIHAGPLGRSGLRLTAGIAAAAAAACVVVALLIASSDHPAKTVVLRPAPKPGQVVASIPGPSLLSEVTGHVESFADVAKEPLLRQIRNTSDTAMEAGKTLIFCLAIDLPASEDERGRKRQLRSGDPDRSSSRVPR